MWSGRSAEATHPVLQSMPGGGGAASGSLENHGTGFKGEAGRLMPGAGVISIQSLIDCLGDTKESGSG